MSKQLTGDQVLTMLAERRGERTLTAQAIEIGVSKAYLSDIYLGRRQPGPPVLAYLGLEKVAAPPLYQVQQ